MGQLHFETHVDFKKLDRDISIMNTKLSNVVGDLSNTGKKATSVFNRLGAGVAAYFSTQALSGFTKQLVAIRGEFQQLEVAFETMLGSKEKADKVMAEVVQLASATPFSLTELGQGAKMLLAFKEPADQVADTLSRMGDLAAGASVPVGDLIKAYGKVSAKGKMQAEELNQFAERGIPIISELAEVVGRTDEEIYKMAEQGEISFADLQQAIRNLTDEGGMFADLMAKQSKTLTGLVSNLGDAWDRMLNDIGQNNEGLLAGGISSAISLVENYEKVVDILKIAIATYGTYKAAVLMNAVAMKGLTGSIKSATIAQQLFNIAAKANPVGLTMAGLTAIVGSLYAYTKHTREATTASEEINKSITAETSKLNYLFEAIKRTGEGTEERRKLIEEVNDKYGSYLDNLLSEKSTLVEIEKAQRSATKALMADIAVKESRRKIDEELSGYTETLQKRFSEFSSVISKMSPAVHAEFLQDLNSAIEKQADSAGDELKKGMLQYSSIAKEVYDKYVSSISQKSGYLKYDFSSFQKAFLDVSQVRVEKNKVINELNGYVDAYQQIFNKINEPATGDGPSESIRKDVEYWENERKAAKEALDKLTKEDADFKVNQAKYLAQIEKAEREINLIRGESEKDKQLSLTDSINEQIQAWERYFQYIEYGHQDLALKQSEALKTTALSLKDYLLEVEGELVSRLDMLDPSSDAYQDAAGALDNVKAKRREVEGGKSVVEQYRDKIEQQKAIFQEYEEWKSKFGKEEAKERFEADLKGFNSYIKFIESELKKYEGRTDPTGVAKRHIVAEEKTSSESDQRKRIQQALEEVLLETQTHKEKLAMLEMEHQDKLKLLEGEGYQVRRELLRKSYEKDRQALIESNRLKSESYKWMYEDIDRMNRQALKDYIQRLNEEVNAKAWSDEAKLMLSEKLAQAEQKLADSLPDALADVSGVLREAATLAGELDEELAKAINTAAELADSAADIAAGIASGNPFQVAGGILKAATSLVKYFSSAEEMKERTEELTESLRQMNEQLDRQATMLSNLADGEKLAAYASILDNLGTQADQTKQQLFDMVEEMSNGGEITHNWWGKYAQWFRGDLKEAKAKDEFQAALQKSNLEVGNMENWSDDEWIRLIGEASGETRKQLEALYDQWVDLKAQQDEYFHQMAEAATGTSFSGLVDDMLNALVEGKRNFSDFANDIEDMLRTAIIQGFKTRYLMDALEPWYEMFGEFSADQEGLTPDELNELRASLQQIMGDAGDAFESLGELGVDLSGVGDGANSLAGAIQGITEDTASVLAGRLNAMHLSVNEHLRVAQRAVLHQAETAANTRRLENVELHLKDIKLLMNTGDDSLLKKRRAGGR